MSQDSRTDIWKMFNAISPTYDKVNRLLSLGQDRRWRKTVARHLPLRLHLEVLDLATGTGDQILALLDAGASIRRAVGLDLADEMLAIARTKCAAKPQVEFIHGDAQALPFPESSFDAITFSFGIRNVLDPVQALREMHRVLKPGGRALVLEFSTPNRWIRPFVLLYLRRILPWLGGLVSGRPQAYAYLNRTIESFASGEEFLAWMRAAQFVNPTCVKLNLGSVSLYVGQK